MGYPISAREPPSVITQLTITLLIILSKPKNVLGQGHLHYNSYLFTLTMQPCAAYARTTGDVGNSAYVPWALDLFNSVCGEEACQPQFVEAEQATHCELSMPLDDGWIVKFNATDMNQKYSAWYIVLAGTHVVVDANEILAGPRWTKSLGAVSMGLQMLNRQLLRLLASGGLRPKKAIRSRSCETRSSWLSLLLMCHRQAPWMILPFLLAVNSMASRNQNRGMFGSSTESQITWGLGSETRW